MKKPNTTAPLASRSSSRSRSSASREASSQPPVEAVQFDDDDMNFMTTASAGSASSQTMDSWTHKSDPHVIIYAKDSNGGVYVRLESIEEATKPPKCFMAGGAKHYGKCTLENGLVACRHPEKDRMRHVIHESVHTMKDGDVYRCFRGTFSGAKGTLTSPCLVVAKNETDAHKFLQKDFALFNSAVPSDLQLKPMQMPVVGSHIKF